MKAWINLEHDRCSGEDDQDCMIFGMTGFRAQHSVLMGKTGHEMD